MSLPTFDWLKECLTIYNYSLPVKEGLIKYIARFTFCDLKYSAFTRVQTPKYMQTHFTPTHDCMTGPTHADQNLEEKWAKRVFGYV